MSDPRAKWRAILLFGMPGSGKGTQGRALGSIPGYIHVATGDIFRQLNKMGQLGKEVDRCTSEGRLVPDELTLRIWQNHMAILERQGVCGRTSHTIILDGLPRTYHQAQLLEAYADVHRVFYLVLANESLAIKRIQGRALKENRADDADEGVIRGRLQTFREQTENTLSYYPKERICSVDAGQSAMQVLAILAHEIAIQNEVF